MRGWVAGALLLAGCDGPEPVVVDDTAAIPLLEGPLVMHEPPLGPFLEGDTIPFEATAEDEDGVDAVDLYYRTEGELPFRVLPLEPDEGGAYRGELSGLDVNAPAVEYYLRAFDRSDFRVPADFPPPGPDDPLSLAVSVVPLAVPYEQPFDDTTTGFGIYEVGWTEYALEFRGERWTVDAALGIEGGAAVHEEGYNGIDPVDDWLVSPVLDFRGLESAEVRFSQLGMRTDRIVGHSVWVSTGSPDPASGDFVKVADVPDPPEAAWAPAPVVDLSAYVGQPGVVIAWRYEGGDTDLWALDDVKVRLFGPDLQLVSVGSPRLEPGAAEALEVTIANGGAPTAGPVTLTGSGDPSRVGFPVAAELPALGTGASATVPLSLVVDPTHPDNTKLPVVLEATDGTDGGTWPVELLVGDETRGIVRLQTLDAGLVRVWIGTGNPLQPHAEEPVFLGNVTAGVHTWEVDLADHIEFLPSEPGRLRWWVRLETVPPASLLGFGIDYDGTIEWTDTVGAFEPGVSTLFYLPGRADPALAAGASQPSPLVPGEPATLELTLRNDGGWTVGNTRVRYASTDPDLTVLALDDALAGPAGWAPGAVTTVEVPVVIDPGHTDSTPLGLTLTVSDEVEVYPLLVDVPVPWPDIALGVGTIADPNGNGDGILDPGEAASLVVNVRNDGQLATGALTCNLVQTSGPSATLAVTGAFVGVLDPGEALDASYTLTASAGAVGDELVFTVTCEDSRASWADTVSVVLGGQGWTPLPLDPVGDALAGAPMDLREGRWRIDGDILSLEISSAVDFDPATLDFEVWGLSQGSGFANHIVIVQAGVAELYGQRFGGFEFIVDVPLTLVDDDTLRLELDTVEMGLVVNEFAFGVGGGFCATPELYCDHWPDGWGNPYAGAPMSTSWFLLTW